MKSLINTLLIPLSLLASFSQASCLSGDEVAANSETALMLQTSYITRTASPWRTAGESAYTPTNAFQDAGIKFSSKCAVIENRLDIDFPSTDLLITHGICPALLKRISSARVCCSTGYNSPTHSLISFALRPGSYRQRRGSFFLNRPLR
ncbi:hypothetical protein [Kosakonia cowanii]|uniref:hypothetical protein n=1 Tax=Kosakonia cowanii TaxID=208223 RepID=UPI001E28EA9A|nr:hypothetical protein [Kosakonia cowanii]